MLRELSQAMLAEQLGLEVHGMLGGDAWPIDPNGSEENPSSPTMTWPSAQY